MSFADALKTKPDAKPLSPTSRNIWTMHATSEFALLAVYETYFNKSSIIFFLTKPAFCNFRDIVGFSKFCNRELNNVLDQAWGTYLLSQAAEIVDYRRRVANNWFYPKLPPSCYYEG